MSLLGLFGSYSDLLSLLEASPLSGQGVTDNIAATPSHELGDEQVRRLFGVVLAELPSLSLTKARTAVAAAGIVGVNAPTQYWDPFLAGVEAAFFRLEPDARLAALRILAGRFANSENVKTLFAQHGYEYIDGAFVPTAILDEREAKYLPRSSANELSKAMKRLVEGDESGAITAACGAVDTLMQQLYAAHDLGDPAKVSFAAKVGTAIVRLRIFEDMKDQLVALGMADQFLCATGADIREGSGEAYYVPSQDFISIPAFGAFRGADHFYNVAFHELTHWTGHKARLDRDLKNRFGSREYAAERQMARTLR